VLLNNCPKLTHLSLTGVQAFLLDELLSFCRDAPPEFNDHQRDVFCVFSGHGVARLRDHLNDQKRVYNSGSDSLTPSVVNESEMGIDDPDDQNIDSESGTNTPVMNVDVTGTHPSGMTPIAPGPIHGNSSVIFQQALQNSTNWAPQMTNYTHAHMQADGPGLSQSAPASTSGALWVGGSANVNAFTQAPPPPPPMHGHPHAHGNAQQVTGMLGATVLDDVDEGDETFGDESELMND
jgi:F-box and leucine-rich repeat protein GRR1